MTIEDDLLDRARSMAPAGIDLPQLIELALETFVRVEALAALGASAPDMKDIPRSD